METLIAVRKARDFMDRCYAEPLDLGQIAAAAGYSRFHFVRAFRAAYGDPPGRYLTRRRVERAQDLLRSANLTVTEVCHLVGFSSLGSFSSLFTELVGMSPAQFQKTTHRSAPPPVPGCYVLMWGAPMGKRATTEKPTVPPRD